MSSSFLCGMTQHESSRKHTCLLAVHKNVHAFLGRKRCCVSKFYVGSEEPDDGGKRGPVVGVPHPAVLHEVVPERGGGEHSGSRSSVFSFILSFDKQLGRNSSALLKSMS